MESLFFMNILLFDDNKRSNLLPLVYTRPCAEMRVGILTLSQKWQKRTNCTISYITQEYLSAKFPAQFTQDNLYVNGRTIGTDKLVAIIKTLENNSSLWHGDTLVALRSRKPLYTFEAIQQESDNKTQTEETEFLDFTYDIFSKNGNEIAADFHLITTGRLSAKLSETNTLIGNDIFIEDGATIEAAVLNTTKGPIYIGSNSEIMEGATVRGPLALCEDACIKMGAKIYGDTTIGPSCKVGGEVSNTVFYANSNKGHDGFLGNSVIGEWCNLGADTNSSNLKNNYASVKLWNYTAKRFSPTGLQFCGLIMGDHSKCGINTMFNTGTVVGVSANIFGASFPRNFIPSFTWGGASGFATYTTPKAFETARVVMQRRQKELNEIEKDLLTNIFAQSAEHRFWENKTLNI